MTDAAVESVDAERVALIETVRALNRLGLNQGTSGNASVRIAPDAFLITPSGVPYEALTPERIVRMRLDGTVLDVRADTRPSTEWRFHRDLLAERPEFGAVVHTHGRAVATLACLRRGIPAFHYMVAIAGGRDIRCAPYATYGTAALSDHALEAMRDRKACLLANHGMIVADATLDKALALAAEVEHLADIYWRALQIGEPALLDDAEMDRVLARFQAGYGDASGA